MWQCLGVYRCEILHHMNGSEFIIVISHGIFCALNFLVENHSKRQARFKIILMFVLIIFNSFLHCLVKVNIGLGVNKVLTNNWFIVIGDRSVQVTFDSQVFFRVNCIFTVKEPLSLKFAASDCSGCGFSDDLNCSIFPSTFATNEEAKFFMMDLIFGYSSIIISLKLISMVIGSA